MTQHLPVLSIIVLFLGAFLTVILGRKNKIVRAIIVTTAALISFVFIILLIKPVLIDGNVITYWMGDKIPEMEIAIGIGLEIDGLNLMFGLVSALITVISGIYSFKYISSDEGQDKYYVMLLMLSGSILGILFTGDLFNMFVMLVLMTFAAAGLTAFRNSSAGALEAAFKLMITSSLALILILLGTVMLYAQFHTLNMAQIAAMLHNNYTPVTLFAFAALIGGFGAKAYLIPSHNVVSDVCQTAPTSAAMLISGIVSMTGVYGIIRILYIVYTSMNLPQMRVILLVWGTATMLAGALMALGQKDLKRFLAYHSISQTGYIFIGFGLSTVPGITMGLFHALNSTFFMALLFLFAGAVLYASGTTDISRLGGIVRKMPQTALIFIIGASSISGLPPFNGFVSKWLIHKFAFESGYAAIAVIALITSLITIISFIQVIKTVIFGKLPEEHQNITEAPLVMRISMWIMALLCLISGVLPQAITKYLITPAASGVLNVGKYIDTMMGVGFAEKWFGEPLKTPAVLYAFPENLEILSLIFLFILMVFVLAAVVGALKPKELEAVYNEIEQNIVYHVEEKKSIPSAMSKLLNSIKCCYTRFLGFIQKKDCGTVNDYALYLVSITAVVLVYLFIFV